jgi:ubiquinone/menaquinone biosynthesis C-methylase UbiE
VTDSADSGIHRDAAVGFQRAADDYERGRPGYPPAVTELLAEELPIRPRTRVLDLAAGTGKLTRELTRTGANVVAVEPVEAMRKQLSVMCPDADVLDGAAEAIPLPDRSVDAVTVAQAFHWFDATAALAEIARVLRPAGGLALVWNRRDESAPWVAEMSRVLHWNQGRVPGYARVGWAEVVANAGAFTPIETARFSWQQPMTRERLVDRVRSISYVAAAPEAEREQYVDAVLALVSTQDEPFPLPYVTRVFWCHREG